MLYNSFNRGEFKSEYYQLDAENYLEENIDEIYLFQGLDRKHMLASIKKA
jgi:hypothetical protein